MCNSFLIILCLTTALLAVNCSLDGTDPNQDGPNQNQQPTENEHSRKKLNSLRILLYALPIAGHYTPILATGEELARRGHNVTLCTAADHHRSKIEQRAERVGVSYMTAHRTSAFEFFPPPELDQESMISKMKIFFSTWQDEINLLMSFWFDHLSLHQQTEWDAIIADDFLVPALMCIHKHSNIPIFLQASSIQSLFQPSKQWFVPSAILGNISARNPSYFERVKVFVGGFASVSIQTYVLLMSDSASYCPDVSVNYLVTDSTMFLPLFIPTVIGLEYPRTFPPMTHYLGPLLSKSPDPLPEDLQQWLMDKPDKSIVYISMGSMFSITYEAGEAFINGILRTNYSAIWAIRQPEIVERLEIDAERAFTTKWAPQLSVLKHKAIRMALLHGGANGINEALYNGVPLIVVPLAGDQRGLGNRVVHQGLGVMLDFKTLTAEKITSSINEIDSGDYRRNVERLQKIFISAGGVEKAADLVEYYKDVGFDHLIPAYAKYEWSWVQYYNVDVYGLLAVILVSVIYCSLKCCQCVWRRACLKRKQKRE